MILLPDLIHLLVSQLSPPQPLQVPRPGRLRVEADGLPVYLDEAERRAGVVIQPQPRPPKALVSYTGPAGEDGQAHLLDSFAVRQEVEGRAAVEQPAGVAEEEAEQWPGSAVLRRIDRAAEPDGWPAASPPAALAGLHLDAVLGRQPPESLILGRVVAPGGGTEVGDAPSR